MNRVLVSTGSPFETIAGYSRAVADGDWCWVSGTTGYDYAGMVMPDSIEEQARNAMDTIERALQDAGFELADVVRVTYYIADAAMTETVFPIVGGYFAQIRPAATMIVADLIKPDMKIEIEVTAKRRS